jgi:hypothetical protein
MSPEERGALEADVLRAQIRASLEHARSCEADRTDRELVAARRDAEASARARHDELYEWDVRDVGLHRQRAERLWLAGLLVQAAGVVLLAAIALALWGGL